MTALQDFTEREREVIALLLEGKGNKQIALALKIANRTVEFHLGNIYAKLGIRSRTEAILMLSGSHLWEPASRESEGDLRKATVAEDGVPVENVEDTIPRRSGMKNLFYVLISAVLVTVIVLPLVVPAIHAGNVAPPLDPPPTVSSSAATAPSFSSKERLLEQIRQLAIEYDRSIQAEKQNGKVELSRDTITGEEIFLFKDESYSRIDELYWQFMMEKTKLEGLYTQLFRDELQPTPFPSEQASQGKAAYEALAAQAGSYCSLEAWRQDPKAEMLSVYQPDEGRYRPVYMGEVIARCEIYGQMLEEFRTAPLLAKVDEEADKATIRRAAGQENLLLSFQSVGPVANAPGRSASIYLDETGTKYTVDLETGRLVQIEPNFPTHPEIPASGRKSMDELRATAEAFALANSPTLPDLKSVLIYEEGNKGDIHFFRWDYRNKDWSGTDWVMMSPFLQVGVLADGQVVIYINTLDLAAE